MKKLVLTSFALGIFILISACTSRADPAQSVMDYLIALTNQDADTAVSLSCADWEEQARLEADSFLSVKATLNNVQCQTGTLSDEQADVTCTGAIDMTYNEEVRSIDLSLRTYSLQYQAGEWRVCGYK